MKHLLTKEEKARLASLCKRNPYKAMDIAENIFKLLQMKTVREFAALTKPSERTIYNHISDPDNSHYEISIFCNDKYITLALNKSLIKNDRNKNKQ